MVKKSLSTYKYKVSAKSSLIFYGVIPYLIIIILGLIVSYLAISISWTFLFSLVGVWFLYSSIGKKNESITLDMKFMIIGNDIVWYQNIEKVVAHKERRELYLDIKGTRRIRICSTNFPTNAKKDFKIKKNQDGKFFKVSQKIIDKVQAASPKTQIVIS